MGRNSRATSAGPADRHASDLAQRLGAALRDARHRARLTQREAARRAGIAQATWSSLEIERDPRFTLATWDRAAFAVGTSLNAYFPQTTAADVPRDAVQLKAQELVIATAARGGWHGTAEAQLDSLAQTSRFGDVVLERPHRAPRDIALVEIIDWFADVGSQLREWPRRLEALERRAIGRMLEGEDVPNISGCWLLRATKRNRDLVGRHSNLFRSSFPGSGRAWIAAITRATSPMPNQPGLVWVAVDGERFYAPRQSHARS